MVVTRRQALLAGLGIVAGAGAGVARQATATGIPPIGTAWPDGAERLEWRADREPASGVFTRIRMGTEVIPVPIADAERLCGELNRAAAQGRAEYTVCLSNLLGRNSKQE